jgi:hypothetical protein
MGFGRYGGMGFGRYGGMGFGGTGYGRRASNPRTSRYW